MANIKLDRESAEAEFDKFCESWDIDNDTAGMDDDDKAGFDIHKKRLVRAFEKGLVRLDDSEEKLIMDDGDSSLTFKQPSLGAFIRTDRYKEHQQAHKAMAYLEAMTGVDLKTLSKLTGTRSKIAMSVVTLFLAS